jgi:hypothetical protein
MGDRTQRRAALPERLELVGARVVQRRPDGRVDRLVRGHQRRVPGRAVPGHERLRQCGEVACGGGHRRLWWRCVPVGEAVQRTPERLGEVSAPAVHDHPAGPGVGPAEQDAQPLDVGHVRVVDVGDHEGARAAAHRDALREELHQSVGQAGGPPTGVEAGAVLW